MPKHRAEGCHIGFVGVISVGCSFFTALGRSSAFSMEAHGFYKFPRGLCEPLAFAIKIGCQHVNCPGCLTGMLKSPGICTKRQTQRYIQTKKSLQPQCFEKHVPPICASASPSRRALVAAGLQQALRFCRLQRLLLLPRYSEIRWSSCSFRATGANQGEEKNRYKCASGCAENPALLPSSSSSRVPLLQHWFNPVLISPDSLS